MLLKPLLAKCGDRSIMAKSHPISGAPENWFSNVVLEAQGAYGISFDFFVDWSANPPAITPVIWIKRLLHPMFCYTDVIKDLRGTVISAFGEEYLNRLYSFANHYSLKVQIVIYLDNLNWADVNSQLLIITLIRNTNGELDFAHSIISIEQFKGFIQAYSGGPTKIGRKGLYWGTSELECFLSHTDSLYPGDVDLVILDNANNMAKCILEYKKHTGDETITSQYLSRYYPVPDARKYNRLAILQAFLASRSGTPPLFIVYYPTKAHITEGRFELLKGISGELSTDKIWNFSLPTSNSSEEYVRVSSEITRLI